MKKIVFAAGFAFAASVWGFSFDDIHFWVGSGTKKTALVIDWGGTARAWGYRWDGENPTLGKVIRAIVAQDARLSMKSSNTQYGLYPERFQYDIDGNGDIGDDEPDKAEYSVENPDSPWGSDWYYWNVLEGATSETYDIGVLDWTSGVDSTIVKPCTWYMEAFGLYGEIILTEPTAAAYSPFGWHVVGSCTDNSNSLYNNPDVVLGAPTQTMAVPSQGLPEGASEEQAGTYVINPAYPPWLGGRLFKLEDKDEEPTAEQVESVPEINRGKVFVTIEFDHDVVDDPHNPFGVDFIVFGNSLCTLRGGSKQYAPNVDPGECILSGMGNENLLVVEVAQSKDGPWYTSAEWRTNGFAPTLGRCYDPDNADGALYSGNDWWGTPTDPTYPVDPRVDFSDCDGLSLATLCQRYNGSAGGMGFDIGLTNLKSDDRHGGQKWFRYLRLSNVASDEGDGVTSPVIDAVADVAPVSGYRNWVCDNFTWDRAWQTNLTDAAASAPNGLPNGLNFVYGLAPTDQVAANVPFKVVSFEPGDAEHVMTMLSPTQMTATPNGLVVKETSSLGGGWKSVKPTLVSSESQGDGTWLNTFTVPKGECTFFKLAVDAE